jgi:Spy/CpxP family protein refolding chaperone
MLEEAKSNPEAFAAKLTPEQRKKLSELAKQIESGNAQKP